MYKSVTAYLRSVKKAFHSDIKTYNKSYTLEKILLCLANVILYATIFSLLGKYFSEFITEHLSFIDSEWEVMSVLIVLYELMMSLLSSIGLTVMDKFHYKEILQFETAPLYKIYFFFLAVIYFILLIVKIPSLALLLKKILNEKSS